MKYKQPRPGLKLRQYDHLQLIYYNTKRQLETTLKLETVIVKLNSV